MQVIENLVNNKDPSYLDNILCTDTFNAKLDI